ncbi:acetyl-coA carboxylase ACC2, partial [Toxoplasma gondii FOU]
MTRQQAVAKIGAHAPATEAGDSASPGVSTQKAGRGRDPAQTKRQAVASAESEAGPGGREDSAGSEKLGVKRDLEAVPSHAAHADSLCTVYSPSLDSNGEQATQSSDHSLISQRGSPESRETDGQLGREGPDACEAGAVSRGNEVLHDEDECRARRLRRTASVSSGSSGCALFSDEATDEGEEEDVLAAFVRRMGGTHVIRRILIANNGTAAVRCIRSMRHWAYEALGNSKALEFVVMATAADIDANAEFIAEADFYVEVPPGPNSNNYANLHLIVQTAETYECDAVWPGWGHASENHRLPAILQTLKRKTIWIGPSPQAMLALGDKIGSAVIAQSVNVPCVPWS